MSSTENHRPNVILIVIDALRARNLGCYGASGQATPQIDKLAEQGILFEDAYSSWNTTDQSLTSILSGKHPRSHGIIHHGDKLRTQDLSSFEKLNVQLISQILHDQGYKTWAVDWMGRWFKKGFDYYGYKLKQSLLKQIGYYTVTLPLLYIKYMAAHLGILKIYSGKREFSVKSFLKGIKGVLKTFSFTFELARLQDSAFVRRVGESLIKKQSKDSFFLFLHFWDTHTPYNCPRKFLKRRKNSDPKEMLYSKYLGAVSYVDKQVGKLVDTLKSQGLLDKTLIIITSDHGESLIKHGIYFDHHGLYEVTTHVPLIFYYPQYFKTPKRVKGFVQHVDLVPTLCQLTGIDCSENSFDGMNLIPLVRGEKKEFRNYVYNEESYVQRKIGLRGKKYKYIYAPDNSGWCRYCQTVHGGKEELYDMKNDPEEKTNIVGKNKEIAMQMKEKVEDLIKELNTKREKQMIRNQIARLKPISSSGSWSTESNSGYTEKGGSMKKKKVSLELPENFLEEVKEKIKDSEFGSIEEYLSYIIEEVVHGEMKESTLTSEEDKKIKKKLKNLGYMD